MKWRSERKSARTQTTTKMGLKRANTQTHRGRPGDGVQHRAGKSGTVACKPIHMFVHREPVRITKASALVGAMKTWVAHQSTRTQMSKIPPLTEEGGKTLEQLLRTSLAESTWKSLVGLYNRVQTFATFNGEKMGPEVGMRFVAEMALRGVKKSYLATMLKMWKMVVQRMNLWTENRQDEENLFGWLGKGIAVQGLSEVPDQALPMTKTVLMDNLPTLDGRMQRGLWLAYKTASRWDEMRGLKGTDVVRLGKTECLVSFRLTKARQKNRSDHHVIVSDSEERIRWFWTGLDTREGPLFPFTTAQVSREIGQWTPPTEELLQNTQSKAHYSAHSVKAGALQVAMAAVIKGHMSSQQLSALAKHAHPLGQIVAPTTVGYIRDKVLVARAAGSDTVTALL